MQEIPVTEDMLQGQVSCETGDGWLKPWRIDHARFELFEPTLRGRAECTAGVRVRFATNSRQVQLRFLPSETARGFDLTIDSELIDSAVVEAGRESVIFDNLSSNEKTLEIWLPQGDGVALQSVNLEQDASFSVPPDPRKRWVTYGSSISHCGAAHSPSRTWPATAARIHKLNLTCLGYGGNCHMEPIVAQMIRDLPADFISLKVGINIQGASSLSPRTFRAAVIGLVLTIREKHPDTPITLVSPIISPPRETNRNVVELSLTDMRALIVDAHEKLVQYGDGALDYYDGLELFKKDWIEDYLPDQLHPDGDGYQLMGRQAAEAIVGKWLQD